MKFEGCTKFNIEGLERSSLDIERSVSFESFSAFTLAEVLITLGVVGVVAAMTLPIVINSTQDKILETEYSKSKSVLANGYKKMMADSEVFRVSDLPLFDCFDLSCFTREHKKGFNVIVDTTVGMKPEDMPNDYIIEGKDEKSPFKWRDVLYMFSTTDGMTYGILNDSTIDSLSIVADVNGAKNPNTIKKDMYKFKFSGSGVLADVSSDLEHISTCSVENPADCLTQQECYSLYGMPDSQGLCPQTVSWNGNSCDVSSYRNSIYCR